MSSDNADLIAFHMVGHTAVLTLSNPPVNVMSIPMVTRLGELVDHCAEDENIRSVVITGEGTRAFCAGSDITEFPDLQAPGAAVDRKLRRQNAVFAALATMPKPTVAALQGLTYGGGLELALCCDLIVAEEQVSLALPETNLGVFPSSGGTYRSLDRVTAGRVKELIFLAEPISAPTALEWGLINRVVDHGQALNAALTLTENLNRRPPRALALAKQLIDDGTTHSKREMIDRSLAASDLAFSSPECAEGTAAFLERRPPQFSPTQTTHTSEQTGPQ
jgi:enoyl-CoA hydratase